MADPKELPSTEYSLKSISWHLKCMVDEQKKHSELIAEVVALLRNAPKSGREVDF